MEAEIKKKETIKKTVKTVRARKPKADAKPVTEPKKKTEHVEERAAAPGTYIYAIGRRKAATAQVRLYRGGDGSITVNDRPFTEYFPRNDLQDSIKLPLVTAGQAATVRILARVRGGGLRGQAEAVRLGIARALLEQNPTFRVSLKRLGLLRRDPRVKERKKYGLKKARRAPQWAKR